MQTAAESDPFDSLLSLEDQFYKEGHDLGVADGARAGLVEGRWFGLEKGFEKHAAMGKLQGRATIWAGRIPNAILQSNRDRGEVEEADIQSSIESATNTQVRDGHLPTLLPSTRLGTHVRTLYALTEPGSLSTENNEESVSDFDDRLKRAEGKTKIIEKLTGESNQEETFDKPSKQGREPAPIDFINKGGEGSIEDLGSLHARH